MNDWFEQFDFAKTVRDYDFTRKAAKNIYDLQEMFIEGDDITDNESESIASMLLSQMEIVPFGNYLKRYLYEHAKLQQPFSQVPDSLYIEIIIDSFNENATPASWGPTSKRWMATAKDWLTRKSIRRKTLFLIGFGLAMSEKDVSEFLTKVLKEHDFDTGKPDESIFLYCFQNHLKYPKAVLLLSQYEKMDPDWMTPFMQKNHWDSEADLVKYLASLKASGSNIAEDKSLQVFQSLLEEVKDCIRIMDEELEENDRPKSKQLSYAYIERSIYSGVPMQGANIKKTSASALGPYFDQYKLTRQRIEGVLKGRYPVERYDIITMEFFIYSQKMQDCDPMDRFHAFLARTNSVLKDCGMAEIYPANSYEAFVAACMLSEGPYDAFNEVWELSYGDGDF